MADLGALAAHGLPPLGLGCFALDVVPTRPRWAFVAINAWRSDRAEQAARVRAMGAELWVYGGPSHWLPTNWRESIVYIRRVAAELGAVGVIADPENDWPDLPDARRRAELRAFGGALASLATDTRVGVSTYPGLPDFPTLADACGPGVWCAIQVYGRGAFDAATFASWVRHARRYFGDARVSIAIAGWAARPAMETREGFDRYLSMLPAAPSNIVWDGGGGGLPRYIVDALAAREVGGDVLGTAAWQALSLAGRPAAAVVLALGVLVVVAIAYAVRRASA